MKRYTQLFIGYLILTLGISLLIVADVGVQSIDSVAVGLQKNIGLTVGTWLWIVNIVNTLLVALVSWKKPYIKGVIGILFVSLFVDGWLLFVFEDVVLSNLFIQTVLFLLGILCISLGAAIYLHTKLFILPWDGLMLAVSERLNWSIKYAKTLIEVIALIIGYLLGGGVGIGTVFVVFVMGYLVQTMLHLTKRWDWSHS